MRICGHVATDFLRAKLRRRRHQTAYCVFRDWRGIKCEEEAEAGMLSRELFERVERLIEGLPRVQGKVMRLRLFNEMSYCEISDRLGCRESTVRQHFWRGKQVIGAGLMDAGYWSWGVKK